MYFLLLFRFFFFFKQKTAYEMRISDWSSDVCSSDLFVAAAYRDLLKFIRTQPRFFLSHYAGFGLASCVVTGLGTWYAAFMGRTFGWNFGEIGLALGLIMGGCGIVGPLISGRSIDAMVRRGRQDAQFLWYGGCEIGRAHV